MNLKIKLDPGAVMPTRAHPWDAGMDLYTPVDAEVLCGEELPFGGVRIGSQTIDTGVHVQIPEGYVGFIKSKSGLNINYGLTAEGVIDSHYTGSIRVKLYNHTSEDYRFKAGEKIAQLVIIKCVLPVLEVVDELEATDRGDNGFGSTGR